MDQLNQPGGAIYYRVTKASGMQKDIRPISPHVVGLGRISARIRKEGVFSPSESGSTRNDVGVMSEGPVYQLCPHCRPRS